MQTVSCGMLKATEMVLTRIRMIFADMVAEPHSVASIALTECRRGSEHQEPLGLTVIDLLHRLLHTCYSRGLLHTGYLRDGGLG